LARRSNDTVQAVCRGGGSPIGLRPKELSGCEPSRPKLAATLSRLGTGPGLARERAGMTIFKVNFLPLIFNQRTKRGPVRQPLSRSRLSQPLAQTGFFREAEYQLMGISRGSPGDVAIGIVNLKVARSKLLNLRLWW